MKIFDISQEVFSCEVYPGDKIPRKSEDMRIKKGDTYNLTSFEMCAHNGTHIDAPYHFFDNGKTIDDIPLEKTVGPCYVAECTVDLSADEALSILHQAEKICHECSQRIIIKGNATVTPSAAKVFAESNIYLLGSESQSIGPLYSPAEVHKILLESEIVLLEGLRLNNVLPGAYFLNAAPLNLKGSDGAPCRAYLIQLDTE